jgi:hypothetical protein
VTSLGDVAGSTWDIGTGIGLSVNFLFGSGATFRTSTPGVWLAGNKRATSATGNFFQVNNNQVAITGIVVLSGSEAPPLERLPWIMRPYDTELQLCKRFYQYTEVGVDWQATASQFMACQVNFPITMRVTPTTSPFGTPSASNSSPAGYFSDYNNRNYTVQIQSSAAGRAYYYSTMKSDARF